MLGTEGIRFVDAPVLFCAADRQLERWPGLEESKLRDVRSGQRVPPAHILIHEHTGTRYVADTFRHDWRDIAAAAGIGP